MPTTIQQALTEAKYSLNLRPEYGRQVEATALLSFVLDKPRSYLYAWPERILDQKPLSHYRRLVGRRANGEPLAYILGKREFWSLELDITPATLIPRPDTELLVERALLRLPEHQNLWLVDLGTGSGAIGLALANERPDCRVLVSDISAAALEITRRNIRQLQLSNIEIVQADWCKPLKPARQFHMLVSNPPYIASGDLHLTQGDLPWEPSLALQSGADGLDAIRMITDHAPQHLHSGGWLLLEHGFDQGSAVRALLESKGFTMINTHRDPAGLERVTEGCWKTADK